jgi:hypothetical protein
MSDNGRPSPMDRLIQQAIGADRSLGREDDPARKKYPQLWLWLSTIYAGRDHVKQPATITIRLGPEGALATLTDRDLAVSMDVSVPHLADVLAALEAALSQAAPPIRSWGKSEPKLRRRKSSS